MACCRIRSAASISSKADIFFSFNLFSRMRYLSLHCFCSCPKCWLRKYCISSCNLFVTENKAHECTYFFNTTVMPRARKASACMDEHSKKSKSRRLTTSPLRIYPLLWAFCMPLLTCFAHRTLAPSMTEKTPKSNTSDGLLSTNSFVLSSILSSDGHSTCNSWFFSNRRSRAIASML